LIRREKAQEAQKSSTIIGFASFVHFVLFAAEVRLNVG
jgi:hypothetical protein